MEREPKRCIGKPEFTRAEYSREIGPVSCPSSSPRDFTSFNLKTAKALGLDVPATLLARADEVIE
jgi:hypothetical protein